MPQLRYTTRRDAIDYGITPALAGVKGAYDLDAICDEAYEWHIDYDADGNELLNSGGYVQAVTDDEFWDIVRKREVD